jgi:hypothetical protein
VKKIAVFSVLLILGLIVSLSYGIGGPILNTTKSPYSAERK